VPHIAFRVDDLEKEIAGKNILLDPYAPIDGYEVAIIEEDGAVIEFVKTDLDDETLAKMEFTDLA